MNILRTPAPEMSPAIIDAMVSEEVKSTIRQIPWGSLSHAYGLALDAPQELENLFSEDEVVSGNAYYDWLYSAVLHQCTMYSASYGAVRVVIGMLNTMNVSRLEIDEVRADRQLLTWLYSCAESSKPYPDVEKEISLGFSTYQKFIMSDCEKVHELATSLIKWCRGRGGVKEK